MLLKRSISLFLAMILITQPMTVLGSENANSSDVLLSVTPQVFSAVVPTQLPVFMSASGVITVAEDVNITNTSKGPIRVDNIELTNVKANWELVNFDSDFSSFKVGSKKLAMSFNGDKSLASGNIPLGASNLTPIDGLGSMQLNYDAKIPAQSTGLVDEIPANVVFTLKWHEVGSADIEESNPNIHEFVPADTKVLTINFKGVTADNDTVTWSSSDEAVATVADHVSKGRARPIDGSKQCLVTAVGSGKATITGVLEDGTSNSFEVIVADKDIVNISITTSPNKTSYIEGENFSTAGMVVTAKYNNGTSDYITDYIVINGSNLVVGQESVTISYNDKAISQNISVVTKSLTSIVVIAPPDKTSYIEGNDFDATGMEVTAYYDNGTNKVVVPTLSRNTNLAVGQTSVDISFGGMTVTQAITMSAKTLTGIAIVSPPSKINYIEANNFDSTGMVVAANYNNGTSNNISDYTVADGANLAIGKTSVVISYNGKTATQSIKVAAKSLTSIAITTQPTKKVYIEANNFDKTGMVVTAYYDNGTSTIVIPTLGRNTSLTMGQTSIDVSFGDKTITQVVTVVAKTLTGIVVTTPPTKTTYVHLDNFDRTGMVVTANYDNGATETIADYTIVDGINMLGGKTSVTINYNGKTKTQSIIVSDILVGTKYINGNYEYSYGEYRYVSCMDDGSCNYFWINNSTNGWGVRVIDNTQTDYVSPKTMIQGKPVTHMSSLFYNSQKTTLNLIEWDTSNVIDMGYMFAYYHSDNNRLSIINGLNRFDTSKVINMQSMFSRTQVTSLDLSSFDTSGVSYMDRMFMMTSSLKNLTARTQADSNNYKNSQYFPSLVTITIKP